MSKLYVVPTPIGNLEDITLKALRVLKEVDFILAEDTRTTSVLLRHYNIGKSVVPYHQNNEHQVFERYCQRIVQGNQAALVTDAGTPAISDPGFLIVRECLKNGLSVECLPGATAFIPALVVSGLPSDRFVFEGFLPHKKGRKSRIEYIRDLPYSVILYESPHRLVKTLEQLGEILGDDRHISVSRELTKVFEETTRGTVSDVLTHYNGKTIKGEFVIVIEGKKQ
ncbi:MAG TPA: 16S rRNA (cytidine(1402)-2'-O)-methyltransferase [Bacteroidales bacterium]|nr:16S rRNA (cytidine(1402)-2'-O)-methyltransferase [Bacteroidales bacterium]HPR58651.1 16S rRNA (cytidine(1402)-2'-O)-methyltransferase [Bacteroidales bacterium]HRW97231.1 16S rRNA (cytidine(1402)-2'-O)-methyltransferase [Bacteroidales bacterium]